MATATHEFDGPAPRALPKAAAAGATHERSTPSTLVLGLQRAAGNAATTRFVHRMAEAAEVSRACECGGSCPTCGGGAEQVGETADAG